VACFDGSYPHECVLAALGGKTSGRDNR